MTSLEKILPQHNPAPWEQAAAEAMHDELPTDLAAAMNPYTTPAENLFHLAGHHSVDLWYEDWPEARKREIIAQYAGVSTLYPGTPLSELKGTHEAAVRFLEFVDAEVIAHIAYPARFVLGRSALGITPLNHPPFKARYLVKVALVKPLNAFVLGRSALGMGALRPIDREPILRAKRALIVSKAPETEYTVSFAWRRPATFADNIAMDGTLPFSGFINRTTL